MPQLGRARLHNGTVYRWNRPVYDIDDGRPHLRVENRVLPAGPTVVDIVANAAFYFGLVRALAEADRPVWTQMPFAAAEENFHAAARDGIDASVCWPRVRRGRGRPSWSCARLLPLADEGLDRFGRRPGDRDRLLGIIEERCRHRAQRRGLADRRGPAAGGSAGWTGSPALREMLRRYSRRMHTNEPVHTWPID